MTAIPELPPVAVDDALELLGLAVLLTVLAFLAALLWTSFHEVRGPSHRTQ
jgi:hypothetical protein